MDADRSTVGRLVRALGMASVVATAVAAVISVIRQRGERRDVVAGLRPRASAAAEVPARHHHGCLARQIASWQPARPATAAGRVAAAAWASPMTAVGLAIAASARRTPQWDAERGCLVVAGVSGASRFAHRMVGADANTVGQVILSSTPAPSVALLNHEAMHARQAERLGIVMVPLYAWLGARYGYADNPLEVAARQAARTTD
ncbi:MAG: hypothetical protein WD007_01560 [Nitriliruptoraceae bacterium]